MYVSYIVDYQLIKIINTYLKHLPKYLMINQNDQASLKAYLQIFAPFSITFLKAFLKIKSMYKLILGLCIVLTMIRINQERLTKVIKL